MRNADQFACPAVYLVVGLAAWHLDNTANFRKWQRHEVIRRAYEAEQRCKPQPHDPTLRTESSVR